MNTLPAHFPELSLLLALLLSVVFWNVVRLVLAALAARVRPCSSSVGMAGYGVVELLTCEGDSRISRGRSGLCVTEFPTPEEC